MLVLSRKAGERLHIGDDIVVTINRISSNSVSVGIDAPKDVRVLRSEIFGGGYEREALPNGGPLKGGLSGGLATGDKLING